MIYLLIVEDTHSDPEYTAFTDLDPAQDAAADEIDKILRHYKLSERDTDIIPCMGRGGWWLAFRTHCGSASVSIRSVRIRT